MKASSPADVRNMYEETADSYVKMMDGEIDLPIYASTLGRLREHLVGVEGPIIDTACGSGHMLSMYSDRFDESRELLGVDLSPRMVEIARERVRARGRVIIGDMRELADIEDGVAAAVLNFFALHHLDAAGVQVALREWNRILRRGGHLVVATWEGAGEVDYGDEADIVAFRYTSEEVRSWVESAGFRIARCVVEPVAEMPMDAIYLDGVRR